MIELSTKTINSKEFHESFAKLASYPAMPTFTSYRIAKLKKEISNALDLARTEYLKWTEPFFEKGEDGKPVVAENPQAAIPFKIIAEKQEEFDKKFSEFMSAKMELAGSKLMLKEIPNNVLSANDILALDPILSVEQTELS